MTVFEAVQAVLKDASEPLRCKEITRRILDGGLWSTTGKTPSATVSAIITEHINACGETSLFSRTAPGLYALSAHAANQTTLPPTPMKETPAPTPVSPVPPTAPKSTLSFIDAAIYVLQHHADGQPMHYQAITEQALSLGLLNCQGQTPKATMYTALLVDIDRATKRGDQPRFEKLGKGFFGLAIPFSPGLSHDIKLHNQTVREQLLTRLRAGTADAFERVVGVLLAKLGFEDVEVTPSSGDGGIDVRGTLAVGDVIRTRMAVQAKRWKYNVQAPVVQQVRGSLGTHDQGLIITTSDFSPGARLEANRQNAVPVALMNGRQLVDLLVEHGIGVRREELVLIELEEGGEE